MKKVIVFFLLLLPFNQFAQQIKPIQDFGVWTSLQLTKQWTDNLSFNSSTNFRLFNNASKLDKIIVELGGGYKLNKQFKLGVNMRNSYNKSRSGKIRNNNRFDLSLRYKKKLSKSFKLYYQLKFQQNFIDLLNSYTSQGYYTTTFRNKLLLKFKMSEKNKTYFSSELFRLSVPAKPAYFSNIRFLLGNKKRFKKTTFDLSFGYERELNSEAPLSFFFTRLIFSLNL